MLAQELGAVRRPGGPARQQVTADAPLVLVACSGGPDSLALAAAVAFEAPRASVRAGAVIVDHGLQDGSAQVASQAADTCRSLGLDPVRVMPVDVTLAGQGLEAAARHARYAALDQCAHDLGADLVLLGHTRDDQAEQVLLGLVRGSGARSLAGMPRRRGGFVRPFLHLPRSVCVQACAAAGLTPWADPHNEDERFARVRARGVLTFAEQQLGPGVSAALARSADLLADDADALDGWAQTALADLGPGPWPVTALTALPAAVRTRVWRLVADAAGGGPLTSEHVRQLDRLLTMWRGQGPVALPGRCQVQRRGEQVVLTPTPLG